MCKKLIPVLLAIALLAASLTACGGAAAPSGGDTDTVRLGFVGPLTGDSAAWGIAQLNMVKLRVDKQNAEGGILGKQIELFSYDNRDDPMESVNVARKLIEQDKVTAVIGPNSSLCGQSMNTVMEEYKVPMLCTNTTLESVTVDDSGNARPYAFRAIMVQRAYVQAVVNYMYDTVGARTAACLYILSNENNLVMVNTFNELWAAKGGTVVASETTASADDVDFRAQLTKIKGLEPDIIFSPFTYKQIILMGQQARELGITSQFCGADSWFQVMIPESAGEQLEGCIAIASLDVGSPVLDPIKAEYREFFGEEQTLLDGGTDPYYGYDAFMMMKKAIEDKGAHDSASIRDGLEALAGVQGCVGRLDMDPATHNPTRELAIMTISKQADGSYAYETLGTVFGDTITLK